MLHPFLAISFPLLSFHGTVSKDVTKCAWHDGRTDSDGEELSASIRAAAGRADVVLMPDLSVDEPFNHRGNMWEICRKMHGK